MNLEGLLFDKEVLLVFFINMKKEGSSFNKEGAT